MTLSDIPLRWIVQWHDSKFCWIKLCVDVWLSHVRCTCSTLNNSPSAYSNCIYPGFNHISDGIRGHFLNAYEMKWKEKNRKRIIMRPIQSMYYQTCALHRMKRPRWQEKNGKRQKDTQKRWRILSWMHSHLLQWLKTIDGCGHQ